MADKQTYFENHNHQKSFHQENNLNHIFAVSLFYLALVLISVLLLMFQVLGLTLSRMGKDNKGPPTSVSPVTFAKVVISSKNFLTFSFNSFTTLL